MLVDLSECGLAGGRRKDNAWQSIVLIEVIADEGNGKEYDVRAVAAAFG